MVNTKHKYIAIDAKFGTEQRISLSTDINERDPRFKGDYPYDSRSIKQYTFRFKTATSKKPYKVDIRQILISPPIKQGANGIYNDTALKSEEGKKAVLLFNNYIAYTNKPMKVDRLYSATITDHYITSHELEQGKTLSEQVENYYLSKKCNITMLLLPK